jgi:DNA primase
MDQISEIKSKIDIVELINGYVPLKKAGRNYKGVCPFHSEKTPSFMVSQELQIFKCFGCGESGDIYAFTQKIEGLDFPQTLEKLAEKAGVVLQKTHHDPEESKRKTIYSINKTASDFYHYLLLNHPAGKNALEYLTQKRGLSADTIKEFKLGYAPDTWDSLYKFLVKRKYNTNDLVSAGVITLKSSGEGHIDKFRGRVVFPFVGLDEKILGFSGRDVVGREPKYLNTSETPVFHKSSFLFGLNKAKVALKQEGAVLVEGPFDVISAYQYGIKNVVAPSGTALTPGQLKLISRYTKDLILCFDPDSAGNTAMLRGIELAEAEDFNISTAVIPEKYADLDELLHKDLKTAKNILKEPIPVYDFFLYSSTKRNNKHTASGKKAIMQDLTPVLNKISNRVVLEHYIKKVSEELDIEESTIRSIINKRSSMDQYMEKEASKEGSAGKNIAKNSPPEYILALILKAPLDTAQTFLYKLGQKDFPSETGKEVFSELKEHLNGRKRKFDIKYFCNKFPEDTQTYINDLYLWDFEEILEDEKRLYSEMETTLSRIKKDTAKRELKELTEKIKQAEAEKNKDMITELSKKIKAVSEKLA